jgi:hypothetical protein
MGSRDFDYGIDITLRQIVVRRRSDSGQTRRYESGMPLDVQLKSSTLVVDEGGSTIGYDLSVNAFNDLCEPNSATPRILILHVQPSNHEQWVQYLDDGLQIGGCCYWVSLADRKRSQNVSTVRVSIPRAQRVTRDSLLELMRRADAGEAL